MRGFLGGLVLLGSCLLAPAGASAQSGSAATTGGQSTASSDIRNILDRRCVVCHSCYDASCQLRMGSLAGVLRGGSKEMVYHTERLTDAQPTRLGIDAQTTAEWRALGFHTVTDRTDDAASLIENFLVLGRQNPMAPNAPIPRALDLSITQTPACPAPDEFAAYSDANPLAGMPYGVAPLADDEFLTLLSWSRGDTQLVDPPVAIPADIAAEIATWEAFLNDPGLRNQLMSRYIYEHLFLARLHFEGDDARRFFQLVRSTTPPGDAIDVIATRRPFDAPANGPVYYRISPVEETIVHKEHLVYTIGPERRQRYTELFLNTDWSLADLPGYGDGAGGNPFTTFAAIPPRSRYEFLLDDALFFVRSFIRGPVCHGQTAVDVIEDRFWVSFLDPGSDLSVTDPSYLADSAALLELPVAELGSGFLDTLHAFSHADQAKYLAFRDARYSVRPGADEGFGYGAIWDGDGENTNALITVFRHFDNASALTGFHGDIPETAWVIDYPIFERLYYNLVAGYDVFGSVEHQLTTRLYMDQLRMESEDTFLEFMPRDLRREMHSSWYRGLLAEIHTFWLRRRVDDRTPTGVTFETSAPKQEFLLKLLERGDGLWPSADPINRCTDEDCQAAFDEVLLADLRALASQAGEWVKFLPEISVLEVEKPDGTSELFSLAHDKAHENVAFLFREESRREPASDQMTIVPGIIGSYPNFFFRIAQSDLDGFVDMLRDVRSQTDWMEFVKAHGTRRASPDFWAVSDRIHEIFSLIAPIQSGVLDLNRYVDPKPGDDPT
ncbi:MAG: fatty acid cis/trans isomerase [Pseudomonadota bacterium]